MTIAIALAIVVAALWFTLNVRDKHLPEPEPESPVRHLEERKARIYEGLRDLNFEFRIGKLSDADYQRTKTDLQRELAQVLAEIEAAQPTPAAVAPKPVSKDISVCPHCNARFEKKMKFCGNCGKSMEAGS